MIRVLCVQDVVMEDFSNALFVRGSEYYMFKMSSGGYFCQKNEELQEHTLTEEFFQEHFITLASETFKVISWSDGKMQVFETDSYMDAVEEFHKLRESGNDYQYPECVIDHNDIILIDAFGDTFDKNSTVGDTYSW